MILKFILLSLLILLSYTDLKFKIIPDQINLCVFVLGILNIIIYKLSLKEAIYGFLLGVVFLFTSMFIDIGGGDVKLIMALSIWVGKNKFFLLIFLSFFISLIVSSVLITFHIKDKNEPIAFGFYISIAIFLIMFFIK